MFNGNKFLPNAINLNLMNKKSKEDENISKNYHYIDKNKREHSYDIIHRTENKNKLEIKNNRPKSQKKEPKTNFTNFLYNADLNKLTTNNENIDENNKNCLLSNEKEKEEEAFPEKYLEEILAGNENDITISSEYKNYLLSNIFKSSKEFEVLKNTLFKDRNNDNKLSKSLQIIKQNNKTNLNQIDNEQNLKREKILNHDDIPIVVNHTNFIDLLEKELANENIYNLNYSNKSWDVSQIKKSSNLSESINNKPNMITIKENYDRDDNEIKEKINFPDTLKIIQNKPTETRSRTPDNLFFKRTNKRKIYKNEQNINNNNKNISNKFSVNKNQIFNDKNKIKDNIINNNNKNLYNNNIINPFQQKKIKNIINNNSITIISHFDIEENAIKKNSDIYNNNLEMKDLNDSANEDITNYMCEEDEEKEKKDLLQKKINELNYEINKYKEERNNLNKTKLYYEKLKSKLNSDIEMFNKQKEEFKNYMINEIGKIKIKQQKYKSNNKIIKNLKVENENLNRKYQESKEIIDSLKKQIFELQNKTKVANNNLSNKKTNHNSSLKEFLTKQDINKIEHITKKDKIYRNRSSLGLIRYNEEKNTFDRKRTNTFITEKDLCSIRANTKEEESFEIHTTIQNKNLNFMNGKKKNYSSKTYKVDNNSKRNSTKDIINKTNENNNIITEEKYNNILKLINNSFRKNSKNQNDKSFIEKVNLLKLNNTKIDKKKILSKCRSNLNITKNILGHKNTQKKSIKYIDKNSNISNIRHNNTNIDNGKLKIEEYEFKIPEKYKDKKYKLTKSLKAGDKIINIYDDNKKEIIFPSGVRKEIYKDGYQIIFFTNGDIKQNYPNGKSIYYFNEEKTVQTKFKNGVFVIKFENNQVEKHYPDGKKQILFPDGSEKIIFNDENLDENSINI